MAGNNPFANGLPSSLGGVPLEISISLHHGDGMQLPGGSGRGTRESIHQAGKKGGPGPAPLACLPPRRPSPDIRALHTLLGANRLALTPPPSTFSAQWNGCCSLRPAQQLKPVAAPERTVREPPLARSCLLRSWPWQGPAGPCPPAWPRTSWRSPAAAASRAPPPPPRAVPRRPTARARRPRPARRPWPRRFRRPPPTVPPPSPPRRRAPPTLSPPPPPPLVSAPPAPPMRRRIACSGSHPPWPAPSSRT